MKEINSYIIDRHNRKPFFGFLPPFSSYRRIVDLVKMPRILVHTNTFDRKRIIKKIVVFWVAPLFIKNALFCLVFLKIGKKVHIEEGFGFGFCKVPNFSDYLTKLLPLLF